MLFVGGCMHVESANRVLEPEVVHQGQVFEIPDQELGRVIRLAEYDSDVVSMLRLMRHFHLGLHDAASAVVWARKAATLGSAEGTYWLAILLFYDDADRSNDAEAIGWMSKAVELGYEGAESALEAMKKEANQALQTTPMTRSVHEKTKTFEDQSRGV